MKRFDCKVCGNEVHFGNATCVACSNTLAYWPDGFDMLALTGREAPTDAYGPMRPCANAAAAGCN